MMCPSDETLSLFVDEPADPELERHVETCRACGERVEEMRDLDRALRGLPLAREEAPRTLHATLRGLAAHTGGSGRRALRVALGAVAAAAVFSTLVLSPSTGNVAEALADQAISSHLRAFTTGDGSGCHVESSDASEIQRWLAGALGGQVEVPGAAPHARLVGARRCQLFGEATPALVYRTDEAPITVFLPMPGTAAFSACEKAMGSCTEGRDGQTVCVVQDPSGSPLVVVGALEGPRLCEVVRS